MPTYDYVCDACKKRFEIYQQITAKPLKACPKCGKKKARRLIGGGGGVLFKGSGFYQTDYRSKSYQDAAKKESPKDTAKDSSKDSSKNSGSGGPPAVKQPDVSKTGKDKK